ncbi:MAG: SDR family NAD(P)-dependent oxidoreductase [Bacilli bacterium]|nr:SDR family NAD(P)-dependent oxidoreductase [Bacilli bacterium]
MNVLITGASSGIGKCMALYLLELGYNLFVVSTDKKDLNKIFNRYKDRVYCIEMDLSISDNCYKLYDLLKDKNIDILINNAGFGDAGNFSETDLNKEMNMINVNIRAYHILTKLFLRDMIKNNRGYIMNVASMASFMPGPYMATYYATKSYILNLTLAIYKELEKDNCNVNISLFCPGPIDTNFSNVANVKFNTNLIDSNYAACYAINNMFKKKLIIIPPNMKLNYIFTKISPLSLVLLINSKMQKRVVR